MLVKMDCAYISNVSRVCLHLLRLGLCNNYDLVKVVVGDSIDSCLSICDSSRDLLFRSCRRFILLNLLKSFLRSLLRC